jgi:hypothetical protein
MARLSSSLVVAAAARRTREPRAHGRLQWCVCVRTISCWSRQEIEMESGEAMQRPSHSVLSLAAFDVVTLKPAAIADAVTSRITH